MARLIAAHLLCKYAGLTRRAVAQRLGLRTGAAVSMPLHKLRRSLPSHRRLARQLTALEGHVEAITETKMSP